MSQMLSDTRRHGLKALTGTCKPEWVSFGEPSEGLPLLVLQLGANSLANFLLGKVVA